MNGCLCTECEYVATIGVGILEENEAGVCVCPHGPIVNKKIPHGFGCTFGKRKENKSLNFNDVSEACAKLWKKLDQWDRSHCKCPLRWFINPIDRSIKTLQWWNGSEWKEVPHE
jgi:hypothetical protein